jgi:hypothetical protein
MTAETKRESGAAYHMTVDGRAPARRRVTLRDAVTGPDTTDASKRPPTTADRPDTRCPLQPYQLEWLHEFIMPEKVSTIDVRQRIGDMLNRIALRHDEFIIERKGKPLAALVPVERLAQMQRFARRQALDFMETQENGSLSERDADDLALEAQRAARASSRKPRSRGTK